MHYELQKVAEILSNSTEFNNNIYIDNVALDSRINLTQHTLFFCIVGDRNNGHHYIKNAYNKGVRCFVISENIETKIYQEANFIIVKDCLIALQQFAIYHRKQFKIPTIGITGSNGKTIIKEWLYQFLSNDKKIVKSPKSYNSQVGVPLSILNIENIHEIGIFEAGISTTNQMEFLEKMIQPNIGIFSNIGPAHDSGFSSLEEKITEKLKLFTNVAALIYCINHDALHQKLKNNLNTYAWQKQQISKNKFEISIHHQNKIFSKNIFQIQFEDAASIENSIHCIVCMLLLKYDHSYIQTHLHTLRNLPMRLELKYGINNCTIIDDAYSADFLSLQIAIDFLNQQEPQKRKTLIISDFEESGLNPNIFIEKILAIIEQHQFEKLIAVGSVFTAHNNYIKEKIKNAYLFEDTEQLLEAIYTIPFENEIILIKGARKYEFENITKELIGQTHETTLEINLNALRHNLNVYKSLLQKDVGIIAMVKAFSYGSGSIELASLLEKEQVSYLAVAYTDEGVLLRKNGIKLPIMVMNPDKVDFNRMLQYQLEPEVYAISILEKLVERINGKEIAIHVKLETGMNRLGIIAQDIDTLITILDKNRHIKINSIFSHLSASEDALFDEFTQAQIQTFEKLSQHVELSLSIKVKKHILNSAGIVRFKTAQFDFVRLGIGLYGVDGSHHIQDKLQTIGRLKTRIAQIKNIKKFETVGYSRRGVANRDMTLAVLAIGYADGFDRRFGNGVGEVFIAGKRAKIIGNICMDMCMVDISHISDVQEGDEVEIYGKEISIIEQAEKIGTIPYELLTSISSRVKRIYYLD
jgi:alanine racemase